MVDKKVKIGVDTGRLVRGLALAIVALVGLCLVAQGLRFIAGYDRAMGFVPQFIMGMENNVPTFFATILILFASALLGIIAVSKYREEDPWALHWTMLAVIFFCLSLDEAASFHELMNYPVSLVGETGGIFYYGWVIPAIIILLLLSAFFIRFLFSLSKRMLSLFLLAGIIYVGGALGGEMASGYYSDSYGWDNPWYASIATFEETLEKVGVLVFVYALLQYIRSQIGSVRIEFY